MTSPEPRVLPLPVVLVAALLIGLPWMDGGRSPAGQATLLLVLASAGAAALLTGRPAWPPRPTLLFLAMFSLVVASSAHTLLPDRTIQTALLLSTYVVAGTLTVRGVREDPRTERTLLGACLISGLLVAGLGIYWLFRGSTAGFYATVLVGPFGYPNAMAGFLLLAGGAACASLQGDRSRLERAAAVVGCGLFPAGLYFTRSRGAVLAACVGILVWALLERERWWARRWLWGGAAALLVAGGLSLMGHRLVRLLWFVWPGGAAGGEDTSVQWRLFISKWTWAMIWDHPWLGVGPGAFPVALTHYQTLPYTGGENPHNLYLEIAAEYGLAFAILAGLAFLFCLVRVATGRTPTPAGARRADQANGPGGSAGGMCGPQRRGPGLELPSHRAHQRGPAWPDRRREPASLDRTAAPPDVAHPDWRRVAGAGTRGRCRGHPLRFRRAGDAGAYRVGGRQRGGRREELGSRTVAQSAQLLGPLLARVDPTPRRRPPGGVGGRRADAVECPPRSQRPRPRGRDGADRRPLGGGGDGVPARRGTGSGSPPVVSRRAGRGVGLSRKIRGEHIRVRARRVPVHSGTGPDQRGPLLGPRRSVPFRSNESYRGAPVRTGRRFGSSAGRHRPCSPARPAGCSGDLRRHGSPREDLARGRHREFLARLDGGGLVSGRNAICCIPPAARTLEWGPNRSGWPGFTRSAAGSDRRPCVTRSRSGKRMLAPSDARGR